MNPPEVGRGVVIGAIGFHIAAVFAIGEEGLVWGDVFADPHLSIPTVGSFDVTAQFVIAMEAIFVIVANGAEDLDGFLQWPTGPSDLCFRLSRAILRHDFNHLRGRRRQQGSCRVCLGCQRSLALSVLFLHSPLVSRLR